MRPRIHCCDVHWFSASLTTKKWVPLLTTQASTAVLTKALSLSRSFIREAPMSFSWCSLFYKDQGTAQIKVFRKQLQDFLGPKRKTLLTWACSLSSHAAQQPASPQPWESGVWGNRKLLMLTQPPRPTYWPLAQRRVTDVRPSPVTGTGTTCLLSYYYGPGTSLETEGSLVSKADTVPYSGVLSQVGNADINQTTTHKNTVILLTGWITKWYERRVFLEYY